MFKSARAMAILSLATLCGGPAVAAEKGNEAAAPRDCLAHFTEEGSFFKGKTYRTWQEFSGVTYDDAFRRVAQAVAEENWGAANPNKDLGTISAGMAVSMGEGSVAPLSIVVKEKGGVIRVQASFGTAGGQHAASASVRDGLCKLVEAVKE